MGLFLFKHLLQACFPLVCFGCKSIGKLICDSCSSLIYLDPEIVYRDNIRVHTSADYHRSNHSKIIEAWKYYGQQELLELFVSNLNTVDFTNEYDCIVPVPLHRTRKAEKGFSPPEQITNYLSEELKIPVINVLSRKRKTMSQALLTKSERFKNVDQAFKATESLEGKTVLLVDDVVTTGATLLACKFALDQQGAKKVDGFCLMRSETKKTG